MSLTGHDGETGTATDIELVLDLSGSMGANLAQMTNAATAFVNALDASDGTNNGTLGRGNKVGIVTYQGNDAPGSASRLVALTDNESSLTSALSPLSTSGGSPHNRGIIKAAEELAAAGGTSAKAMVLFTDAQTGQAAGATAATNAKNAGVKIYAVGFELAASTAPTLKSWASPTGSATDTPPGTDNYQSASTTPADIANELIEDIGVAVAVPATFSVTETLGAHFTASGASATVGTVNPSGPPVWSGTLGNNQSATLTYTTTRDGSDLFAVTNETVSSSSISVGGVPQPAPPNGTVKVDVLPCGGTPLAAVSCEGGACNASGSQGGTNFTVNAGAPTQPTQVFLTGFGTAPPFGVCAGFNNKTNGVQADIRPLSTAGTFQITLSQAALGGKKWWQTDVCIGTNMRFITAIGSFAHLKPSATLTPGAGTIPGRWWGLLPSIPRYVTIPGLGTVKGPWITSRAPAAGGGAVVKFTIPFIPGSAGFDSGGNPRFTTNGLAAYDPRYYTG